MMTINKKLEPNIRAWAWRFTMGPACILDGVVATLSLGFLNVGAALSVARNLARSRMLATQAGRSSVGFKGIEN